MLCTAAAAAAGWQSLVLRIFDVFLAEGLRMIYRLSIAIIHLSAETLLQRDFVGILEYFRTDLQVTGPPAPTPAPLECRRECGRAQRRRADGGRERARLSSRGCVPPAEAGGSVCMRAWPPPPAG